MHRSELVRKNKNDETEENMYIEDIGRPSQPISWILQEINKKVRILKNENTGEMISPKLEELNYEDELSEMVLEYVDDIVVQDSSF